jgi:hypothetical protein
MGRGILNQFPNLSENEVSEEERMKYASHLDNLRTDMTERFTDVTELQVPVWLLHPFSCNMDSVPIELQEELIDLRSDDVVTSQFSENQYDVLWYSLSDRYPVLWASVNFFVLSFPASYLVEKGFSAVVDLLTKKRNRLNIIERGDLRLYITNFKPNVQALAAKHTAQRSH